MDIHTRQLRYFMELAKCLNFTKAAMNLYIAQPALSQQIADLEKQLGVTLFERSSRSVVLTAAGKALQEACPEIFKKLESVEQQVLWAQAGLRGSLRIGYLNIFQPLLPGIMREFRRLYPDIALEICGGNLKELRTLLEGGDIDIAFAWINRYDLPQGGAPAYQMLWQEDLCVAVEKQHPFAVSGGADYSLLDNETFILLTDDTVPGFQLVAQEAACEVGLLLKKRLNCRQFSSALVQVEAGVGASILPGRMKEAMLYRTEHIAFFPIKRNCMDFGVLWYSDSKNAALSPFLDLLEKTAVPVSAKPQAAE